MSTLAAALLAVAQTLPASRATDRGEHQAFLEVLASAIAGASEEAACEGAWSELECTRRWPGPAAEVASLALTVGWWESKLDPEVQSGRCYVWGPSPTQIGCDGVLFRSGYAPPKLVGVERRTRWGLVVFRSNTVFQVKVSTNDRLREIVGLGEMQVFEAAREAVKILSGYRGRCRTSGWVTCVVTGYAGTLEFRQAPARAAMFQRVYARVRAETKDATERRPVQVVL